MDLKKQFNNTAELYRIELCKLWECQYGNTDWVSDEPGGMLMVGDFLYLTFDDVRYIVENKVQMETVERWQDYNVCVYNIKSELNHINLKHWVMGCPHVDASAFDMEITKVKSGWKG